MQNVELELRRSGAQLAQSLVLPEETGQPKTVVPFDRPGPYGWVAWPPLDPSLVEGIGGNGVQPRLPILRCLLDPAQQGIAPILLAGGDHRHVGADPVEAALLLVVPCQHR